MRDEIGLNRLVRVAASVWSGHSGPISLVHFVTRRCDARCPHCFIDFNAPWKEDDSLTLDEIETIASRINDSLINVNITGGEPFLNRNIWPICAAWLHHGKAASVYVTTHGGFPDRVEYLAKQFLAGQFKGRLFVSISIDNFQAAHDCTRQVPDLYARALDSHARLSALNDDRVGVGVSITVTEYNYDQVLELYRHLREAHNVSVVTATLRRVAGAATPLTKELVRRVGAAYLSLTDAITHDLAHSPRRGARNSLVARVQDAKDEILYAWLGEDAMQGSHYRTPCRAGRAFVVLLPDGGVGGCEIRNDASLGNIRDFGLDIRTLLKASTAKSWRRRIRDELCHCSYECAQGINILASPRYFPRVVAGMLRSYRNV